MRSKWGAMKSRDLGRELVDQEGAARAQRLRGLLGDLRADAGRQGREGQAGEDVIGMVEAEIGDDLAHVGGRAGHREQPVVGELAAEIAGEIGIGVDRDQGRVGRHAAASTCSVKVPTPGPYSTNSLQFAQSTGASILSISRLRGGNDRADHHRMLDEAAQEVPERAAAAPCARSALFVRACSQDADMHRSRCCGKQMRWQIEAPMARRDGRPARLLSPQRDGPRHCRDERAA